MANTSIDYGVAHFYGLRDTRTYMTVQSDSISNTFALDVEVSDEQGRVITDRLDDKRIEITFEGVLLSSAAIPDNGLIFTYNGVSYITKSVEDKGTNKDFRKVSVQGIKYQEIA